MDIKSQVNRRGKERRVKEKEKKMKIMKRRGKYI